MSSFNWIWILDANKFLTEQDIIKLMKYLKHEIIERPKAKLPFRNKFLISLFLNTGLRVQEVVDLKCGDLFMGRNPLIVVRNGKGNQKRIVKISKIFREYSLLFLEWKRKQKQDVSKEAPLFCNKKGKHLNKRSIQNIFESIRKKSGIPLHYSLHCLRHTFACFLLRSSKNIRLVQKQLGHKRLETTQIYADVMDEELTHAVEGMYEGIIDQELNNNE